MSPGSRKSRARSILQRASELQSLAQRDLLQMSQQLRWNARSGARLDRLLPEVFALGVEATRRVLGFRHYPVQVLGGIDLFEGHVTEMQTGEGKTITAVLPALLRGMVGRGVHVVTANSYLAERDAHEMGKIYSFLGLSSGCILPHMDDEERRRQYACDITYGTASEMGFDFLRDRLKRGAEFADSPFLDVFASSAAEEQPVQRELYCALIDEADSILIDEARTPLVIGVEQPNSSAMLALYHWCRDVVPQLTPRRDFIFDERQRAASLTQDGCRSVTLISKPIVLDGIETEKIYQYVEKALTAQLAYERDRDYVVTDGEVVIVDEGTGRKMDGRKWQEGLHQSVEAKEGVDITAATASAAKITIQSLYRRYEHLAGMTGTATQARREFRHAFHLTTTVIPTHRPCRRVARPTRVFVSLDAKITAVIESIQFELSAGRALLVGTPSVDASQVLSARLQSAGIPHAVLNALHHADEAKIVKHAGQLGKVTIATNMAGRGTDILLHDDVRKNGGLHVIATEMHSSKRIDRQLIGRCARQGDPGSYQFFLSLEDELLRVLSPEKHDALLIQGRRTGEQELPPHWISCFERVQKLIEREHCKMRRHLLKFDQEQKKRFRRAGLDPYLEVAES